MIRLLITDDHPIVRRGLKQILMDEVSINLIHEAANSKELFNRINEHLYDVILLDISLPGRSGIDLISQIKKIQPKAAILMLSIHSEEMYALRSLKDGASGYITKSSPPEEIISAIIKVANGERYISQSMAELLAENLLTETRKFTPTLLSGRELEVLRQIAMGRSVAEIAELLCLSPKTISTYRHRLLEKLKLHSSADLIRYAIRKGVLDKI